MYAIALPAGFGQGESVDLLNVAFKIYCQQEMHLSGKIPLFLLDFST
jgi:hypothetical protein